MKKTKKLLSLLTALTITASAFAGLAVPASAAETQIGSTYDFESYNVDVAADADKGIEAVVSGVAEDWKRSGTHANNFTENIVNDETLKSKVLQLSGSHGGGRTAAVDFPAAITPSGTDPVKLEFDWYSQTGGNKLSSMDVIPSGTGSKNIFKLRENAGDSIEFNDAALDGLTRGWYRVSAVLDFETHRIIEFTLTKNGESTPAVTKKDIPFIDNTAADISQFGLVFNRGAKDTAPVDIRFDNVAAYTVTDTYYKVEMNIKDSTGAAVKDATVTLGGTKYVTGDDGKVVTKLANGSYAYEVSKIGFVDGEGNETATGTIAVSSAAKTENVTYSLKPYTPVVTTAELSGGQKVVYAPAGETPAATAAFAVNVADQNETAMETGYTTAWAVYPTGTTTADANVTIANGIVSVTKGYTAASGVAGVYDVIATVTDANDATKSVEAKTTITVTNNDVVFYDAETAYVANEKTSTQKPEVVYDIADVTIPEDGLRITFDFTKGAYDSTKDDRYGQLSFVSGSDVLFTLKDMNAGLKLITTDEDNAVIVGTTVRGEQYPVEVTIIGNQALVNFNNTGYKVVEMAAKPTNITELRTKSNQDNGSNTGATNLIMSTKVTVDKNAVNIIGDDNFAKITGRTVTKDYTAKAIVPEESDSFTWTVTEAAGVSIDPDSGRLSVTDEAAAGTVTVTATSGAKSGSLEVEIADVQKYTATVEAPKIMNLNSSGKFRVTKVVDALGDEVTEYFTPVWSIDGAPALDTEVTFDTTGVQQTKGVAISALKDENGVLQSLSSQEVAITGNETKVSAEEGAVVMLWDSLEGMTPLATPQTADTATIPAGTVAAITKNGVLKTYAEKGGAMVKLTLAEGIEPSTYPIMVDKYYDVVDYTNDMTEVDIADLATDDDITGYQVTVADADGSQLGQHVVAIGNVSGDKVGLPTVNEDVVPTKVEVAPVYTTTAEGELLIPAATYNIEFTTNTGGRADLYVNDQIIVNNINQDSQNFTVKGSFPATEYSFGDIVIAEGYAQFSYRDNQSGNKPIDKVVVVKAPSIVERATRVYVIGDSLVATYHDHEGIEESKKNLARQGWGEALKDYIKGAEVTNLGNSGAKSHEMLANAFTQVRASGKKGDILVLESGYNDTDSQLMKDSIKQMVIEAENMGITVFVVPPNASTHAQSEYTGNVKSHAAVKAAVTELKSAGYHPILIDLSTNSSKFFERNYGAYATVSADTAKWNNIRDTYNNSGDTLHSTVNAANAWAAVVAKGIYDYEPTREYVDTEHSFTITDTNDATHTVVVNVLTVNGIN